MIGRIKKGFLYLTILVVTFFICIEVNALSDIKVIVWSPDPGMKICSRSNTYDNNAHLYAWFRLNGGGTPLSSWPGEVMTKDENNNYCYTVKDTDNFNYIIFNNGSSNDKTIDLSTIKAEQGLINSYLYIYNNRYDEGYIGEWYVYDGTALSTLTASANSKVSNRLKYTKPTYNTLKTEYNISNGIVNYDDPYGTTESPYIIYKDESSGDAVYSSPYVDAYNRLSNAIDGLKERLPIVINDELLTGVVTAGYTDEESNDNYVISIDAEPITGYKTSEVKAYAITGYNDAEPVLGEELTVTSDNNGYQTEFSHSFTENLKGIYIDANFVKKTYKIRFTIDANGKLVYIKDGSEFDVGDVIEVEHGDDFLARIIANEGYVFKSATVNGNNVTVSNNYLNIDDIGEDQDVVVTFTIKTYTVSIDDKDYVFAHGTTYEEILSNINMDREGYVFVGLVDKNNNRISKKYKVTGNDTLYTLFRKKEDIINPETGINILKIILLFGLIITLLYFNGMKIEKRKKKKV